MHALGRVEPPEGHLHPGADGQSVGVHVGHLASVATAAVEVDDGADQRRREAEGQVVDGVGGHRPSHVGQALRLHLVDRAAGQTHPGGRQVHEAAHRAPAGRESELPELVAAHGRRVGAFRIGSPRRLAAQLAPPGEEQGIGQVGAPGLGQLGHGGEPGPAARTPARRAGHRWSATRRRRPRRPATGRRSPGPGRPARARRPAPRRPGRRPGSRPGRCGRAPAGRPAPRATIGPTPAARLCSPATTRWSTSSAAIPARSRASANACAGQGDEGLLAEPLLPLASGRLTGDPPAVEELVGGRRRSERSRPRAPSGAKRKATAPSPAWLSSAPPASPVRRSDTTPRVGRSRPDRAAVRRAAHDERTEPQTS